MAHRNPPPLFSHSPAPPPISAHAPLVHPHSHSAGHNKENPHHHHHHYQHGMPLVVPAPPSPALSSHSHSSSHSHHSTTHHHRPPASPTKAAPTTAVNHYVRPLGGSGIAHGGGTAFAHRPPTAAAAEPTMTQLLATQGTALGHYASPRPLPHHTQSGAGGDATMANATGVLSWRKGQGFKEWEKAKLASPEVKRKADVAQLCASPLSLLLS